MRYSHTLRLSLFLVFSFFILPFSSPAQTLIINTVAGDGTGSFGGDGGPAVMAEMHSPMGVAVDRTGSAIIIADELNHRIRRVNISGIIGTIAGVGPTGVVTGAYGGDCGLADTAHLNAPFGVALDTAGNVYIADNQNYRIRKITAATGIITTLAGTGILGYTGDGTPATNARLGNSMGITVDAIGNVYFSDITWHVVRKIDTSGIITTVAGNGVAGYIGDGVAATNSELNTPRGVRTDALGNLYIADQANGRIRKVDAAGIISTVAGGGTSVADSVAATTAVLNTPWDVALDADGNFYFTDMSDNSIRKVGAGIITTIFKSLPGSGGDTCAVSRASMFGPAYLDLDAAGNIYFSDKNNNRVRKISKNRPPLFAGGHAQYLTVCDNITSVDLDTLLSATDADVYQLVSWSMLLPPVHGSVTASYSLESTTTTMYPTGTFYYTPTSYYGLDSFSAMIVDCAGGTDTTTIYVTINDCSLGSHTPKQDEGALHIYPNPAAGAALVMITSPVTGSVHITVTNTN